MNGTIIRDLLKNIAPEDWQCKWDNSGLLVGDLEREIKKVLVTVDVTNAVIDAAIAQGVDLIVSHHPMIFSGIKRVTKFDFTGNKVLKLIQNQIAVYAMHTNFDASDRGMGMVAAEKLQLQCVEFLGDIEEKMSEDAYEVTIGIGAKGILPQPMTLKEFCEKLKLAFGMDGLRVFAGETSMEKQISRVALCPGSGKDYIKEAMRYHADVYVTGDITHHIGLDTADEGLVVIDCGHYQMEWIFIEVIANYLREMCGEELEVIEDDYRPSYQSV